jgi:hypothetical protein
MACLYVCSHVSTPKFSVDFVSIVTSNIYKFPAVRVLYKFYLTISASPVLYIFSKNRLFNKDLVSYVKYAFD